MFDYRPAPCTVPRDVFERNWERALGCGPKREVSASEDVCGLCHNGKLGVLVVRDERSAAGYPCPKCGTIPGKPSGTHGNICMGRDTYMQIRGKRLEGKEGI